MELIEHFVQLSGLPRHQMSSQALNLARFSLLDWMTCGMAGAEEPVAKKLRCLAEHEGGQGASSIFGGGSAPARMAALVNGGTSHALDYDDTHFAHVGHLSVAIYPAALSVAEEVDASAEAVVEAFLVGAEAAIRVGLVLGRSHYNQGFHQTATAGAFGATLASGRLYGLSANEMRNAIGLCATRASGLKSQFGTMGKPYNAGIAASNGVECAKLAALGMTSADDGLMGDQGFVATHTRTPDPDAGWRIPPPGTFLFEDNKYKLHACCHGTHAMIEALGDAGELKGHGLDDIATLKLRTNPRWLRVCDLKSPRTGLEVKFSYGWLAGMAIRGDSTGDDRVYSDSLAEDSELRAFSARVEVTEDDSLSDLQAVGMITLNDGTEIAFAHDLAMRLAENVLAGKLRAKSVAVIGGAGETLWASLAELQQKSARDLGTSLRKRS